MTDNPPRHFDYPAVRAALHQRALERGIDSIEGATSYQAALVQAELRVVRTLAAPDYGWWQRERSIFSESDAQRSSVSSAFERPIEHVALHRAEYIDEGDELVPMDAQAVRELWQEVRREVVDRAALPLKTIHEHQLAWAEAAAESDREINEQRNAADRQRRLMKRMQREQVAALA